MRLTGITLTSSRVVDYRPPSWPGDTTPKQLHLDLRVENLEDAQVKLTAAGARLADHQPHPAQYRVFIDPAGHPFCACLTADWA